MNKLAPVAVEFVNIIRSARSVDETAPLIVPAEDAATQVVDALRAALKEPFSHTPHEFRASRSNRAVHHHLFPAWVTSGFKELSGSGLRINPDGTRNMAYREFFHFAGINENDGTNFSLHFGEFVRR